MSDSETDGYVNYSIHSKDIQTARKEIEQFEKILHEAKKNYKEKYNDDYDNTWYSYITHFFNLFNPLSYVQIKQYIAKNDDEIYEKGYNMYSSYYDNFSDIDDFEDDD